MLGAEISHRVIRRPPKQYLPHWSFGKITALKDMLVTDGEQAFECTAPLGSNNGRIMDE
jgi:hypothetical protein